MTREVPGSTHAVVPAHIKSDKIGDGIELLTHLVVDWIYYFYIVLSN